MKTKLQIAFVFWFLGLTFCNGGSGLPVLAQVNASVRRISISEATGGQGQPAVIELAPGMGVNISFLAAGETIEKVWLDNPSFVTLDDDGCLAGLGTAQQAQNCSGASVLHLRRINPLQFPNLPQTNSSLLTTITSANRVYLFRVVKVTQPKYYTVEIIPPSRTRMCSVLSQSAAQIPTSRAQLSARASNYDLENLNRGLEVAVASRFVSKSQPLYGRIQNFLALAKAGKPIELAAQQSGISMNLVKRLNELGMNNRSSVVASPSSARTTVPASSTPRPAIAY